MSDRDADPVRRLPPGPHGLSPELVARNQRERLIAAMAEVCAEQGYEATTVVDVVRTAGVSTASFYRQFEDKRACMLASFEELFGRLFEVVEASCPGGADPAARVKAGIETAASLLASDVPTARLLTLEVLAIGSEGARAQHEAIDRLAASLRKTRGASAAWPDSSPSPEWVAVAAMVALVARQLVAEEGVEAGELLAIVGALNS